ncbi:MAG: hypothetical protein KBA64_12515 [Armatimonadetes bacterium]|jgi:hypothetical protein|nr:hypothetical protein [Armatimonadota bacterium]MDI9602612.1 hypothetical protein [Acidobacteriota bacterium]NLN88629.1 hypothetical protein [candidate division WS1 bacterium]
MEREREKATHRKTFVTPELTRFGQESPLARNVSSDRRNRPSVPFGGSVGSTGGNEARVE